MTPAAVLAFLAATSPSPAPSLSVVLRDALAAHAIPGAAVAVFSRGRLTSAEGYGVRSLADEAPVGVDTVWRAASLTKPVFAHAVLELVAAGRLDLDLPLVTYRPPPYPHEQGAGQPAGQANVDLVDDRRLGSVTARLVLQHATGWPNWSNAGPLRFEFDPGARWQYSGEGFVYLQRVVEHLTGQALPAWVEATVLEPVGMSRSGLVWDERWGSDVAAGHRPDGTVLPTYRPRVAVAAGSLLTTLRDYAAFVGWVLGPRRETLVRMTECGRLARPEHGMSWGLGWGIEDRAGRRFAWQWGKDDGFAHLVMLEPASGDGLVVFTNGDRGMLVARAVADAVLGRPHPVLDFQMLRPPV